MVLVAMAAALVAVMEEYEPASAQVPCAGCDEPPPVPLPDDTTPPTVIKTFPQDGATNVGRDVNIKAKFSEAMDKSSICPNCQEPESVRLYIGNATYADLNPTPDPNCGWPECPTSWSAYSLRVSYHGEMELAILRTTKWRLPANSTYTAVVEGAGDSDGQAVKDKAGNEMAKDYIWHFTTGAR